MAKRKKGQTTIYKTLHRKLKIKSKNRGDLCISGFRLQIGAREI
jgi:hypothetical protein